MNLAAFGIDQFGQLSPDGAVPDDLPGTVAANAEDEILISLLFRSSQLNILFQHLQGFSVYR